MISFHRHCNVCNGFIWDGLPIITYPTPPYLLLRELIGPRPDPPIVRRWLLIGLRDQYESGQSQSGQSGSTDDQTEEQSRLSGCKKIASIQDRKNKALVYDKTMNKLFARSLEGSNTKNKAIFEINCHRVKNVDANKMLISLKLKDSNLYLSCSGQNGELIPKETAKLQDTKMEADDSTKPFLFYRVDNGENTTFESFMYPRSFISTVDKNGEPVTLTGPNIDKVYVEFVLKEESTLQSSRSASSGTRSSSGGTSNPYYRFYLQFNRKYVVSKDLEWCMCCVDLWL